MNSKKYTFIDKYGNELVFDSKEEFEEYLNIYDFDYYKFYMEQEFTKDDYDGHDIGTATALAIEEQNNSF